MPRYLLQQWTADTMREEDEQHGSHGTELWATPSSNERLLDLVEDDVVVIAGVVGGRVLPICGLTVKRTATREDLLGEGFGHDMYDLPYFALGKFSTRMNLRIAADQHTSLAVRKADGSPLARRAQNPQSIAGQAFRTPQWIDATSAKRLLKLLDGVWQREDDEGLDDPGRVARGLAPRMTAAERKAVELRAMNVVVGLYRREGYDLQDVSATQPWDLTATHPERRTVHVEVKGTSGAGDGVIVTGGERRHAEQAGGYGAVPALVIVSGIKLERGSSPSADGGTVTVRHEPWDVDSDGTWTATVWRYEPIRTS